MLITLAIITASLLLVVSLAYRGAVAELTYYEGRVKDLEHIDLNRRLDLEGARKEIELLHIKVRGERDRNSRLLDQMFRVHDISRCHEDKESKCG